MNPLRRSHLALTGAPVDLHHRMQWGPLVEFGHATSQGDEACSFAGALDWFGVTTSGVDRSGVVGVAAVVGATVCFALGGVLTDLVIDSGASAVGFSAVEVTFAALLLLAVGRLRRVTPLGRRDLVTFGWPGLLQPAAVYWLIGAALVTTTPGVVSLVSGAQPFLVAAIGFVVLRERLSGRLLWCMTASFLGIGVSTLLGGVGGGQRDPRGVGLVVLAVVLAAVHAVASRSLSSRRHGPGTVEAVTLALAQHLWAVAVLWTGVVAVGLVIRGPVLGSWTPKMVALTVASAAIGSAGGNGLLMVGFGRLRAALVAQLSGLSPVIGLGCSIAFRHEEARVPAVIGAVVVSVAVGVAASESGEARQPPENVTGRPRYAP